MLIAVIETKNEKFFKQNTNNNVEREREKKRKNKLLEWVKLNKMNGNELRNNNNKKMANKS